MKGVFLGSDFMYRQDGKLVPIEINTEIAIDNAKRVETFEETFNVFPLVSFVVQHGIKKLILEGSVYRYIYEALKSWQGPELDGVEILHGKNLTSYDDLNYEDDTLLAIRTTYSDDALIDYYCKDKVEFLSMIQNEGFGQSFLYKENDELKGSIECVDNGNHPNFIVKCRFPSYSPDYPKLLRFETEEQVRDWAEENLENNYYVTPFLYNENSLLEFPNGHKRLALYRHIAVLVATSEGLLSIPIGIYTKWTNAALLEDPSLDMYEDGVLKEDYRQYYLTKNTPTDNIEGSRDLLAEKDDEILMSDGTWKKVQDLKEGDVVKGLKVEGKDGADIHNHVVDYNESLEEFEAETEFEEATIAYLKGPIEGYVDRVRLTFEDDLTWTDTAGSSYLMLDPEDGTVRFQTLRNIKVGDTILLLEAGELDSPVYIEKTVTDTSTEREFVEGYGLTLDGSYVFLSRESGLPEMFASIEHNDAYCKFERDMTSVPRGYYGTDTVSVWCTSDHWTDSGGASHQFLFGCAKGNHDTVSIPPYVTFDSALTQYGTVSIFCEPGIKETMCTEC